MSAPITEERLAELERLYREDEENHGPTWETEEMRELPEGGSEWWIRTPWSGEGKDGSCSQIAMSMWEETARLATEARNALPDFIADVRKLRAEVERLRVYEPRLTGLSLKDGGIDVRVKAPELVKLQAAIWADWLTEIGAENYAETQVTHEDGRRFAVRVQRVEGKTPHELRRAAEEHAQGLAAQLEAAQMRIRMLECALGWIGPADQRAADEAGRARLFAKMLGHTMLLAGLKGQEISLDQIRAAPFAALAHLPGKLDIHLEPDDGAPIPVPPALALPPAVPDADEGDAPAPSEDRRYPDLSNGPTVYSIRPEDHRG